MVADITKNCMKVIAWNIRQKHNQMQLHSILCKPLFFFFSSLLVQLLQTVMLCFWTYSRIWLSLFSDAFGWAYVYVCAVFYSYNFDCVSFECNALDIFCYSICNTFIVLSDILNFSWHKSKWSLQVKLDEFEVCPKMGEKNGKLQNAPTLCMACMRACAKPTTKPSHMHSIYQYHKWTKNEFRNASIIRNDTRNISALISWSQVIRWPNNISICIGSRIHTETHASTNEATTLRMSQIKYTWMLGLRK